MALRFNPINRLSAGYPTSKVIYFESYQPETDTHTHTHTHTQPTDCDTQPLVIDKKRQYADATVGPKLA